MITVVFIFLVALCAFSAGEGGSSWGYHTGMAFSSPDHWKNLPGTSCGSYRQSPINIVKSETTLMRNLKPVTVSPGQSSAGVTFAAKPASIDLSFSDMWTITFGGVGCLRPVAIHWHWGLKDSQGSEHTLDGLQYAMEAHLVTYNCNLYNNSAVATTSPSGLYVFGILYQIGSMNNAIGQLIPHIDAIINNRETTVREINPINFFPTDLSSYFRYEGSLTTPPCTENVIWTVFNEVQTIDTNQIMKFRSVLFGAPEVGPMGDNFRPTIPLKVTSEYIPRVVYASFKGGSHRGQSISVTMCLTLLFASLMAQ